MKNIRNALSALLIIALLLTGVYACAEEKANTVTVSTVDELLAAIAPDTRIVMKQGIYDLKAASDYGRGSGDYYRWSDTYDGYELIISGADNLTITADKDADVTISAVPRYANVMSFENMSNLTLKDLTCGHTKEQGVCGGGVLRLSKLKNTLIDDCELYGCGTIGVDAYGCSSLNINDCDIYECSNSAVSADGCRDVRITDCDIYKCVCDWGSLFSVSSTNGFAVVNCEIEDNSTRFMLYCSYSPETYLLGCETENNYFSDAMFYIAGKAPVVEDCELHNNDFTAWYDSSDSPTPGVKCLDGEGNELSNIQLEEMKQRDCKYDGPVVHESAKIDYTVGEDGKKVATVKTADEFLAAIGPNVNIRIEECEIDLATASDFGSGSSDYYYWRGCYDGAELVITGVDGLSITSETVALISAEPRYANVINFEGCSNIWLSGFTAGHTSAQGECTGGVLNFNGCTTMTVDGCRLYGCGILGILADSVDGLTVQGTEIYDCSYGAVSLNNTHDALFAKCNIHDCPRPEITVYDGGVNFENENGSRYVDNGCYTLDGSGLPELWTADDYQGNVMSSVDPAQILIVNNDKVINSLTLKKGDDPAKLTANVIMPDGGAVRGSGIIWMCDDDESGLELDSTTGETVNVTSKLEEGQCASLYVFYIDNGSVQAQTELVVMG